MNKMPLFSGRCRSNARLDGKTAVITGGNTGIGKETVKDFYKRGAKVIMACRTLQRAEEAKRDIETACKDLSNLGEIITIKCDVSSMKSVRECAQKLLHSEPQINILVNNAGVLGHKGETEDGFDLAFATNHLGHFLLTLLLLPRITSSQPARIVTVASIAHLGGEIHFDDLHFKSRPWKAMDAYSQSKLANVMFSRELAKKLQEHNIDGVTTYSLHPGLVRTEIGRHLDDAYFPGFLCLCQVLMGAFTKSPKLGAQTTIYCAVDEKCANETGLYYSDCVVAKPSDAALDDEISKKLWEVSLKMAGLENFNPFAMQNEIK